MDRLLLLKELTYFIGNDVQMRYAPFKQPSLPIDGGPVEVACKTIVMLGSAEAVCVGQEKGCNEY